MYLCQSTVIKTRNRGEWQRFCLSPVNNSAVRRGERDVTLSVSQDAKSSTYEHHSLFKRVAMRRLDGCQTSGTITVPTCSHLIRFEYLFTGKSRQLRQIRTKQTKQKVTIISRSNNSIFCCLWNGCSFIIMLYNDSGSPSWTTLTKYHSS